MESMESNVLGIAPDKWKADCVLVLAFENDRSKNISPALWKQNAWLLSSPAVMEFKGKSKELVTLYGASNELTPRVLLVGLGKQEKATVQSVRHAVATASKHCREKEYGSVAFTEDNLKYVAEAFSATTESIMQESIIAANLGLYRCEQYKGTGKKEKDTPNPQFIVLADSADKAKTLESSALEAQAEAEGVVFARDLANGPANYITPEYLATEAKKLAKECGFSCNVLSEKEAEKIGMGAFCSVARGAEQEGRFIVLEYAPKGKEKEDPFVVVGKGITFDTGGISLKPSAKMHEMKGDMAGAAAVLGFFKAIGKLPEGVTLPRIIGLVPAAENMPGGRATRPGDIVTTLSGQTVEILNTDAEGRLILCDALTYAQKNWKPKALIDIATLTGACVIALGDDTTGLFTDNCELRKTTLAIAEKLGELCWPLPMWKEYDKNINSDVADMANIGPREGGAVHAAIFLRRFIEEGTLWMHLDVAGPANVYKTNPLHPVAGATGEGVRLFLHLAKEFINK